MSGTYLRVALDHPLATLFDYRCDAQPAPVPGTLVQVPFGKRQAVGLVCEVTTHTDVPPSRLRAVDAICTDLPPLSPDWLALVSFAADYYQRGRGEVALPALPQALRDAGRWGRLLAPEVRYRPTEAGRAALPDALPARGAALRRLAQALVDTGSLALPDARALHPKAAATLDDWAARGWVDVEEIGWADAPVPKAVDNLLAAGGRTVPPALTDQQAEALDAIRAAQGFAPFLLHGVTGSGKTEVYLHALASLLDARPDAQALVLVPEINLTPQFEAAFRARFAGALADDAIVTLHSGLAEGERARNWLAAHTGRARIVLGTRLAVLASMPTLALIVVDEEHEPAYKQQEGLRYSARDLAVWRAKQLGITVVLGSATPSLESWWQAEQGRYMRLTLARRAVAVATLPTGRGTRGRG